MTAFLDLSAHTRVLSAGSGAGQRELIVLAPPRISLAQAEAALFERVALRTHDIVRLVVRGAALVRSAPPDSAVRVLVTELDAYQPAERAPLAAPMVEAASVWLRRILDDACPGLDSAKVFWGSASVRALSAAFVAYPMVLGLAHHHGHSDFVCLDPSWVGFETLVATVAEQGGHVSPRPRAAFAWRTRMVAHVAGSFAAVLIVRAIELLREPRLPAPSARSPRLWLGIVGTAPGSSRHVVAHFAAEQTREPLGILLQGKISKRQASWEKAFGSDTELPGLRDVAKLGRELVIEQAVSVRGLRLAQAVMQTARATARSIRPLLASGSLLSLGPFRFPLQRFMSAVARLVTFDVLRAIEARMATEAVAARHDFRGAKVVFPHASLAPVVASDSTLQAHGAVTAELVHGSLGDAMDIVAHARSQSNERLVWTAAEARYYAPHASHQRVEGGFLPAITLPPPPTDAPLNVLILSNYAHPVLGFDGPAPRFAYQQLMFEAVREATEGLDATLRWRPHPSDDRAAVERTRRDFADLRMQCSMPPAMLHDDLAWAHVIVACISTTLVEALCGGGRALFVHDVPFHERDVLMCLVPKECCFASGAELKQKLERWLDGRALDAEARFRAQLFD